jgi:hypothetical protein
VNSVQASLAISALRPPFISLNQPYPGEAREAQLEAVPVTYNGPVREIAFFDGPINIGVTTNSPWTLLWSNINWGDHLVTAVVRDTRGGVATSAPVSVPIFGLISKGSPWKYLDDGSDAGTSWRDPMFDDNGWASGPADLGYGHNCATILGFGPDPANKFVTTYFRRSFEVRNIAGITNLTVRLRRDDGAVVYVNGVEAFRSNMPEGPVDYSTLAASPSYYDDEGFLIYGIPPTLLIEGTNVIAVEVHQVSRNNSGLGFDFALIANLPASPPSVAITAPVADQIINADTLTIEASVADADGDVVLVEFFRDNVKLGEDASPPFSFTWSNILSGRYALTAVCTDNTGLKGTSAPIRVYITTTLVGPNGRWKYLDNGSDQGSAWRAFGFDDSGWPSGVAPLGYGNHPRTVIGFGPDPTNKYITTYFRKVFDAGNPSILSNLTFLLTADAGAVVYLNGNEIFRKDMPAGPISYDTLASFASEDEAAENSYARRWVNPVLLAPDANLLAIEVHQNSRTNSDLRFDLNMVGNLPVERPSIEFTRPDVISSVFDPEEGEWVERFVVEGGNCTVCAAATDSDGEVVRVEVFADGAKIGEFTQPPYCLTWSNITACNHELTATATDNSGAVSSTFRAVTVISAGQFSYLIRTMSWPWLFHPVDPDLKEGWPAFDYDETGWQTGSGQFGNVSSDTFISSLGTTVFRHHFDVRDPGAFTNLLINFQAYFGEGALFYLNGVEAFRINMPTGAVTLATAAITNGTPIDNPINPSLLRVGENVMAVEVHHPSPDRGATEFDFSLAGQQAYVPPPLLPCFSIEKPAPDYAHISWGDIEMWYLEAAANIEGPWRGVAFYGSYDVYLFSPTQQFFRLHHR